MSEINGAIAIMKDEKGNQRFPITSGDAVICKDGNLETILGDLKESVNHITTIQGPKGVSGPKGAKGADGADGKNIELQKSSTHLQWRLVGDAEWKNLIAISELVSPSS